MLGTLAERFAETVARWPGQPALLDGERVLTWGALDVESDRLASFLASEAGVRRDDVVGLLLTNRAEFGIGFVACQKLGAISSCLNFRIAADALAAAVVHEDQRALLHNEEFAPAVRHARTRAPSCSCVSVEGDGHTPPLAELAERGAGPPDVASPRPRDLCNVIHTSGTTGMPKGAAFTQETQMLSGIQYCLEMALDRGRVGMSLAPVVIGAATNFFVSYLFVAGARQVMAGDYEPAAALRLIERHGVTEVFAVPTQIYQMAEAARESPEVDLSSLRLIRTGGSAMPRELVRQARESLGCDILNTYGTTESCTAVTNMHTAHDPPEKWGSIGKPTYFQEVRVIPVGDGEAGPDDVIDPPGRGQLINRGPQAADCEFRAPDRPLKDDRGWQYTRDVVEVDEDGYLSPVDRLDNVIISGGENVYPQEVELFLARHPDVEDVAVMGVPDPEWGERVCALIVARDARLTPEEIERFSLEGPGFARHKRPRMVGFVDSLPRNILGKLDRAALPALYREATSRSPAPDDGGT